MKIQGIILLFILFSINMNGQTEMLIGQISGRVIVRENFDKEGAFLNKQTFNAEDVKQSNEYYELKVITELFDKDRISIDKYTTTYRCKPDEASILVLVFPFSNPKSKKTVINSISQNFKELYDLEKLEDIELEISFDSGLLDFFGSKSTIKIFDRELEVEESFSNIKSKIVIKAYALGIRIKQLNYTVNEELNSKSLLTIQKFTEEDGSYFTITYK